MIKRPLCILCLLMTLLMFLADYTGLFPIRTKAPPSYLSSFLSGNRKVQISGEVSHLKESGTRQNLILSHVFLLTGKSPLPIPDIKVNLPGEKLFPPGSLLLLSGLIREIEGAGNPGEFDFKIYYASRNVFYSLEEAEVIKTELHPSSLHSLLVKLRHRFTGILQKTAGEDSAFFTAIALGDRTDLSTEASLLFQLAGILHILSISGLHIGILGISLRTLLKKAGTSLEFSILVPLIILIFYGMLTGNGLSLLRAVTMYLISSFGQITGRIYDMPSALSLAAILLLLERPACLYSSSFLLSFGAMAGIGYIFPVLSLFFPESRKKKGHTRTSRLRKKPSLLPGALLSLSVFLASLPVTMYFYSEVSLAGLFINLLAVPGAGIILSSALSSMLLGSIWLPAGIAAALPGRLTLAAVRAASRLITRLPFSSIITGQPSPRQILLYYLLLIWFLLAVKRTTGTSAPIPPLSGLFYKVRRLPALHRLLVRIFLLVAFTALSFRLLSHRPPSRFSITCLDVGQGDCIVIRTPENQTFLIDGGSSDKKDVGRTILLPYLKSQGISHVNAAFISHTDSDHISGIMEFMEYIKEHLTSLTLQTLVLPDWKDPPDSFLSLKSAAQAAGIQVAFSCKGKLFESHELDFRVLSPVSGCQVTDPNDNGAVLLAEYRDFTALFPGDISEESENALLKDGSLHKIDYLKVAHHGSRSSSGEAFLHVVSPQIGVISCSRKNTYGHPAPEAVKRLEDAGCRLEYTMNSGAVTVYYDSGRLYVERTHPSSIGESSSFHPKN